MTSWRDQAACLGEDPELFFPQSPRGSAARKARAICAVCRVRIECIRDAEEHGDLDGIRGGLTGRERCVLPKGLSDEQLAEVIRRADAEATPAGSSRELVHAVAAAAAITQAPDVPPDQDAAEHRAVLLRELDAFEAATEPGQARRRWPEVLGSRRRRIASESADSRGEMLRSARNEALRLRRARLNVPAALQGLEREYWRTQRANHRKTRKGRHRAA
jgi:WhiB family redox-sensing transcriptional regulator